MVRLGVVWWLVSYFLGVGGIEMAFWRGVGTDHIIPRGLALWTERSTALYSFRREGGTVGVELGGWAYGHEGHVMG